MLTYNICRSANNSLHYVPSHIAMTSSPTPRYHHHRVITTTSVTTASPPHHHTVSFASFITDVTIPRTPSQLSANTAPQTHTYRTTHTQEHVCHKPHRSSSLQPSPWDSTSTARHNFHDVRVTSHTLLNVDTSTNTSKNRKNNKKRKTQNSIHHVTPAHARHTTDFESASRFVSAREPSVRELHWPPSATANTTLIIFHALSRRYCHARRMVSHTFVHSHKHNLYTIIMHEYLPLLLILLT